MPFQYILANLLAENDGAVGVLFLDATGEAVDLSVSEYSPDDMRLVGAYLGIHLRQIESLAERAAMGGTQLMHIAHNRLHIYVKPMDDGYFLALVQRRPGSVGCARYTLNRAASQLQREVLASG